jgi:hypothetical protein
MKRKAPACTVLVGGRPRMRFACCCMHACLLACTQMLLSLPMHARMHHQVLPTTSSKHAHKSALYFDRSLNSRIACMHESPHTMACGTKCSYSTYQFNWINPTIKLNKRLLKFPYGIIVILMQILHTIEFNLILNGPDPIKFSTIPTKL